MSALPSGCLAIVFEATAERCSNTKSGGRRVFSSFVDENRGCFWNVELVEAISSLVFVGFVRPSTLFVSSSDREHLHVLRSAWSRRLLKPAKGFRITSLGEVGHVQINEVEQLQFVPLAEIVCRAIADMNRDGRPATVDSLRHWIAGECTGMAPPSSEMLRHTLSSLAASGLVYRMGEHLFVGVPSAVPYHTTKTKCTRECQTGASIVNGGDDGGKRKEKINEEIKTNKSGGGSGRGLFARLFRRGETPRQRQPLTFTAQFPPPEWICSPTQLKQSRAIEKPINHKFYTFADNLCAETSKPTRTRKQRWSRLSSSSECLNYGPIDPPECLPPTVLIDDLRIGRTRCRGGLPLGDEARTSTPAAVTAAMRGSSDSAYSVSPVVTDGTGGEKFSSWSGSEANEHTYVNMKMEHTRFENDTTPQMLEALPAVPVAASHLLPRSPRSRHDRG